MSQGSHRVLLATLMALVVLLFIPRAYADFTEARYTATHLFLSAFPYAFPSLQSTWRGGDFCNWHGVTCDNSTSVTWVSVNLVNQNLTGSMPVISNYVTDYNLPVYSIDLSDNRGIAGTFNTDWAALRYMVYLNLSSTHLYGSIPDSWNNMRNLVTVNISHTYACKGLPNWNIPTLRTADLSNNKFRGVLASSWGNMTGLTHVDISGNSFCGCIPSSWNSSTVLQNAAAAIGGNLISSSCESSNKCTSSSYKCVSAAAAPVSVVLMVASLMSLLVAIAAL
jgi:hypothetical protein